MPCCAYGVKSAGAGAVKDLLALMSAKRARCKQRGGNVAIACDRPWDRERLMKLFPLYRQ